jgi:hypothetical protein
MELNYQYVNGRFEKIRHSKIHKMNEILNLKHFQEEIDKKIKKFEYVIEGSKFGLSVIHKLLLYFILAFFLMACTSFALFYLEINPKAYKNIEMYSKFLSSKISQSDDDSSSHSTISPENGSTLADSEAIKFFECVDDKEENEPKAVMCFLKDSLKYSLSVNDAVRNQDIHTISDSMDNNNTSDQIFLTNEQERSGLNLLEISEADKNANEVNEIKQENITIALQRERNDSINKVSDISENGPSAEEVSIIDDTSTHKNFANYQEAETDRINSARVDNYSTKVSKNPSSNVPFVESESNASLIVTKNQHNNIIPVKSPVDNKIDEFQSDQAKHVPKIEVPNSKNSKDQELETSKSPLREKNKWEASQQNERYNRSGQVNPKKGYSPINMKDVYLFTKPEITKSAKIAKKVQSSPSSVEISKTKDYKVVSNQKDSHHSVDRYPEFFENLRSRERGRKLSGILSIGDLSNSTLIDNADIVNSTESFLKSPVMINGKYYFLRKASYWQHISLLELLMMTILVFLLVAISTLLYVKKISQRKIDIKLNEIIIDMMIEENSQSDIFKFYIFRTYEFIDVKIENFDQRFGERTGLILRANDKNIKESKTNGFRRFLNLRNQPYSSIGSNQDSMEMFENRQISIENKENVLFSHYEA